MVDLVVDDKPLYAISCLICLIKINLWEKKPESFSPKHLKYLIISTLFMACLNNAKNNIHVKGKMSICFVRFY